MNMKAIWKWKKICPAAVIAVNVQKEEVESLTGIF
jgi:hypothetical protein